MTTGRRFHALTWAWWALAAVVTVQLAPNPTYVVLVVAVAALVAETHAAEGPLARAFPVVVAVAVAFVGVRLVLTGLTTHTGEHVLFRLPEVTLPPVLSGFTIGGTVEAGVLVHTAVEGLVIVGIVAVFGAFNAVVSHHELVRAAPRAFHEVGLVVTVALAFVPATLAAIGAVREADRARTGGRPVRRGRVLRTVVPVLESGMERAVDLADSMDARGFGHGEAGPAERRAAWLSVGAMAALGAAFVALVGQIRPVAAVLAALGTVLLLGAVASVSTTSRRPRYRPTRPAARDLAVMAAVSLAPAGVLALSAVGETSLRWRATVSSLPPFDPVVALVIGALALPALVPATTAPRPARRAGEAAEGSR